VSEKCAGIRSSGYWKGYRCGAVPKYEHKGKRYCANHYAVATKDSNETDQRQ